MAKRPNEIKKKKNTKYPESHNPRTKKYSNRTVSVSLGGDLLRFLDGDACWVAALPEDCNSFELLLIMILATIEEKCLCLRFL